MAKILGTFKLVTTDPPLEFEAILTKTPVVIDGYGGWIKVPRPRRRALTDWVGRNPVSIRLEFLIDQGVFDLSAAEVEAACRRLERMAGLDASDPEPPLTKMISRPGGLIPHDYSRAEHVRWFIEAGPEWSADETITNRAGNRTRAGGTLVMTQYTSDRNLESLSAIQRRKRREKGKGTKRGSSRKRYTVKKGDTLSSIAARQLGSAGRWREIAKLNKIRDPKRIEPGDPLKLP